MADSPRVRAADPRPGRTRAAIKRAVTRLAASGCVDISVHAIAREAGISRTAFYSQFSDLDALAMGMLADAFEGETGAESLVDFIARHRQFFRASLDWRLRNQVQESVVAMLAERLRARMAEDASSAAPSGVDPDDAALFLAGGAIAVLTQWVRDDEPEPAHAVAERLDALQAVWLGQRPV